MIKKFLFVTVTAFVLSMGCAHKAEFKMGEKMESTEGENQGVVANINFTKYRKDEIHFLITLQNFYEDSIELTAQNFTFKYNGIKGTVSRFEFPSTLEANMAAKELVIFKYPSVLPKGGTGELEINLKGKGGKALKPLKFEFQYPAR